MSNNQTSPLMPQATAVWLIKNTALTFEQIADFCRLNELEVQAIADGEVAKDIAPRDPIAAKILTKEEIQRCSNDESARLTPYVSEADKILAIIPKTRKYTPVANRQNKPSAIYWILRNHPEVTNKQISQLIGTTNTMIENIRTRKYWDIKNLVQHDPVLLGLCSQVELDKTIAIAQAQQERDPKKDRGKDPKEY